MPYVPNYQPGQVSSVRPTSQRFQAPSGPGAAGIIAEVAAGAARIAGEFDKRQAIEDETEARKNLLKFQEQAAPIIAEAQLSKGVKVGEAYKAADEALRALRDQIAGDTTAGRARNAFMPAAESYLSDFRTQLGRHEVVETHAVALDTLTEQARASAEATAKAWNAPDIAENHLATGMSVVARRAELEGRASELLDADLREYRSGVRRATFERIAAEGDTDLAIAFQAAHEDELTAEDSTAIASTLRGLKENRQAYSDAAWALGAAGHPDDDENGMTGPPAPAIVGNLPLDIRYKVKSTDGSTSTVRTISIGTDKGEVLIPTVVDGKILSNDAAVAHFRKTGENFGTFASVADADAYADWLHKRHARELEGASDIGIPASALPTGGKYAMPVKGGRVTSPFGAPRGATAHNGVDWAAPKGSDVRPMAAGEVVRVDSDPRSGKFVIIDHGDGTTTSYSHLGRQDVKVGDKVTASSTIGAVGMTGQTTGPHVHVVARQMGKPVDPVSLLGKGAGSTRSASPSFNLGAAFASIDRQPWSFERKQRAKAAVEREVSDRDQAQAREEREADRQASEMVLRLGGRFTSLEQLGSLRNTMSVDALRTYTRIAAENAAPREVEANGEEFLRLSRIAKQAPDLFATFNLGEFIGKVTAGEMVRLSDDQGRIIRDGQKETDFRSQIEGTISSFVPFTLTKTDRIRVHDSMSAYLRALTGGKRPPTSAELRDALNASIRTVTVERPGRLWGTNSSDKRVFDITIDEVPESERNQARASLRRLKQEETDDAVISLYLQKLARQQAGGQ